MTYSEAVSYILDIPKFTKKNDAEHTKLFLRYLGDPHHSYKVIHVAGTNGKGSVCAYIDAMLRAEGARTGLFTSPHLVSVNERIAVDGVPVSDGTFTRLAESARDAAFRMEAGGLNHPTFFEVLLGMALCAFREAEVDYAVLETGLGGRLDATSAVEPPEVCVITSIGYDHMQYLGDTLAEIAAEKAGIIRPGVPVFYAESSAESDSVIRRAAENNGCFCKKIGKDAYEILGTKDKRIAFSCVSDYYGNTTWELNNIGKYQPGNALLAMETMRWLTGEKGHPDRWRAALSAVEWPGRMEEVLPGVYVDGAHNVSAVEAFAGTVSDEAAGKIIVFSAVRDKEYGEMVRILCEKVDAELYVATHIDDPRGTSAEQLGRIFRKYTDRPVVVKPSAAEALLYALSERKGRKVYCLGSLYLTGMIKKLIQEVKQMLDYEEEISKFKPSLEVEGIEEAVYQEDLTDVTDLLKQVIDQKK